LEHVPDGDQERVRDGQRRAVGATAGADALVLGVEVGTVPMASMALTVPPVLRVSRVLLVRTASTVSMAPMVLTGTTVPPVRMALSVRLVRLVRRVPPVPLVRRVRWVRRDPRVTRVIRRLIRRPSLSTLPPGRR
jgi:hypothetical protein